MENLFIKLINMSITASWIALAVIVLRLLLKKAPKAITCLMWVLVAIRLICPFSVESILSLIPSTETIPDNFLYSSAPSIKSGFPALNSAVNPVIGSAFEVSAESSASPTQTVMFIASVCWIIGVVFMLIYTIVSYLKIYKQVREAVLLKDNIWLSDKIDSPFIFGIIRPRIYLPFSISEEDAEYVIAHEQAHIKRHDNLWKPLGFALLTVYWFNPILWIAYILLCRDIEMACDEKVVKELGVESKKPYSNALINCSASRKMISACPLAFGEVSVKSRIKSVLNYKKPAFWVIIVAVVACIAASVCFLTNPTDRYSKENMIGQSPMQNIDMGDPEIYNKIMSGDALDLNAVEVLFERKDATDGYVTTYRFIKKNDFLIMHDYYYGTSLLGHMKGISIDEIDFGTVFRGGTWENGYTFKEIKDNNKRTLKLVDGLTVYYLFEQKDGSVCVAIGRLYKDESEAFDGMYLMKKTETQAQAPTNDIQMTASGKRYSYVESEDFTSPTLTLSEKDNEFVFVYSALSSYIARGKYELKGNKLTLRTDDGNNVYVFRLKDRSFIFDAKRSSKIPEYRYSSSSDETYSPVPNGAEFIPDGIVDEKGEFYIDKINYDIDDDGIEEELAVKFGPTYGLFTFDFSVYENKKLEYHSIFNSEHLDLSFVKDKNGKLFWKGVTHDDEPEVRLFDIKLKGNYIELYCDGESLSLWGGMNVADEENYE